MPYVNGQFVDKSTLGGTKTQGGTDLATILKQAMAAKLLQSTKLSNQLQGVNLMQPSADELATRKKAQEKATAQSEADKKFRSLEDLYMSSGLAQGPIAGIVPSLAAYVNPNTDYAQYKDLLKSSLAGFAKAGGDTGNIGLVEQLLQLAAFPGARSNPDVAKKKFGLLRTKYGLPERTDYTVGGKTNTSAKKLYGSSLELND